LQYWFPSALGRLISRSPRWILRLDGECLDLRMDGSAHRAPIGSNSSFRLRRGLLWSTITLHPDGPDSIRASGLPNGEARRLETALAAVLAEQEKQRRRGAFDEASGRLNAWLGELTRLLEAARDGRRWITHEQQQAVLSRRPDLPGGESGLRELFHDPVVCEHTTEEPKQFEKRLEAWRADWPRAIAALNERHVRRELAACRDLFDRVESRPLTEEQARAAICFDNRVQAVAAAGSGKTSTMVAKAAYAIHRGFARPERILMLAFNKKAARELEQRAALSFRRLGWEDVAVRASTFHALGLRIVGESTGRKPRVPDWAADAATGVRKLSAMVERLREESPDFRARWDLFRVVFGRDLPQADDRRSTAVTTLRGELVRSGEECRIADWLFFNGVSYEYEARYEFDTVTADHSQYHPDFYYPDVGLYHEHFALDEDGNAPPHFERYLEGVTWKREEHQRRGTSLVETTSHDLRTGEAFTTLERALTDRGVVLEPDPDRRIPRGGEMPLGNGALVSLMRTFIGHAKSNCLTVEALHERLLHMPEGTATHRHRMFLELVGPVMQAWDAALAEEDGIDFEDMLNLAAEHLEEGRWESPYDLVLADEFQDASLARARLCDALVRQPGRHLYVVGDDWQAINRFAGADLSVMTGFRERAGHGQVLRLEQTFRCPQELCDVAGSFVTKNPRQIRKQVRSAAPAHGPALEALRVDQQGEVHRAVERYMARLHRSLVEGLVPAGRDGRVSVFVLGRYRSDEGYVPRYWEQDYGDRLRVEFLTMHRSKGAEADYVILPGMVEKGFPNLRGEDSVLSLAMPEGDTFPWSEERRLFYVALTRARRSVAMFTVAGKTSPFLKELIQDRCVTILQDRDPELDAHSSDRRGRDLTHGSRPDGEPVPGRWPGGWEE
jgi:DNA helicase-4